jgi:hypothetical protein
VCAINVGRARPTPVGCSWAQVGGNPIGSFDELVAGPGTLRVRGWAIDPDTALPAAVHVYLDGTLLVQSANVARPDIGSAFPDYGPNHGFDVTNASVAAGRHEVCVYAINSGLGSVNPRLGCPTVTVGSPFGSSTTTVQPGRFVAVTGWAVDPDSPGR